MHPSALEYGKFFFETYCSEMPNGIVVDIGAQNVNGSLKDVCPKQLTYIGVDFVEGNGVDVILTDPYSLPFDDESIDVIVSSSCFEHSEFFWLVFNEMLRVLKPNGLLYLNAPSNGYIHRYPVDCWRFYPDAGMALVNWAKHCGMQPALLESFTGRKFSSAAAEGEWNDFICIFVRDQDFLANYKTRITQTITGFDNALVDNNTTLIHQENLPQDMRKQVKLQKELTIQYELSQKILSESAELKKELTIQHELSQKTLSESAELQKELNVQYELSQKALQEKQQQFEALKEHATNLEQALYSIGQSNSWRITGPLRLMGRLVRNERPYIAGGLRNRVLSQLKPLYWRIPIRYRKQSLEFCFKYFGSLFRGVSLYEQWKNNSSKPFSLGANNQLLSIESINLCEKVSGSIAIHLHMYYADLADEFADYLKNMPFDYDLFISTASAEGSCICKKTFTGLPHLKTLVVEQVPNHGRDIAPMFCTFGSQLKEYDYIAHLHSKKSLYNKGATEGWREYLCSNLLGSEDQIRRIFNLLRESSNHGIVYPQNYISIPYAANTWLANKSMGTAWCHRLGIDVPKGYFDFPAGSMFWAKGEALAPLFNANISLQDFAEEAGQTDGTFAHCLERLLVLSSLKQGLKAAILQERNSLRWSKWGLEQYAAKSIESMLDQFDQKQIKVIAFDIFDTLLIRPLLDPEKVKNIVALRVENELASLYLEYRSQAEAEAREEAKRDIGLDEIYRKFASMTTMSSENIEMLKCLEIEIEQASVEKRNGCLQLFNKALSTGKPVVLISDMFLPKKDLKLILDTHGIQGWSELFLSSDIGLRKDTGKLYEMVLSKYQINPNELLMVGDNERSDLQIPCDMGITCMHVLKPVELARGLSRFNEIINSNERSNDVNRELTLGLVVNKNFSEICYPDLDANSFLKVSAYQFGYSLIGPLLLGMSQWLIDNAKQDKIDCLYFLAREGQLIYKVYDLWSEGLEGIPNSKYLVLSRRATSIPAINDLQDVLDIASISYFPNILENFLYERFGLTLSPVRWADIENEVGLKRNSTVHIENKNIRSIQAVLELLYEDILQHAKTERSVLERYFDQIGLGQEQNSAIVDVGYGGTIQGYLNKMLNKPLHGYYILTDNRSQAVKNQSNVFIKGCYFENINTSENSELPAMFAHSFELEKMLSSSDGQVVKYELDAFGELVAQYRELSLRESQSIPFREELQVGVFDFVKDALHIRSNIFPDFKPSIEVAKQLYEEFISNSSDAEKNCLKEMSLDDHYCGRGVVN